MSCHGLNHVFYRLGRWAEITGPHSPHSLRHAFGRDTHRKGAPTAVVQDLMGHSSIRVTKIYSRFDDEDLKAAHNQYSPTY
jgi:site-specific recombinase XerD